MRGGNRTVLIVVLAVVLVCALLLCCAVVVGFVGWQENGDRIVRRTSWPQPVCTPPACADGEVYYCPGDCPGGCGTQCATPTPFP